MVQLKRIQNLGDNTEEACYQAFDDKNNLIGETTFYKRSQPYKHWYIDTLRVEKEYERQGFGTAILNEIKTIMFNIETLPIEIIPSGVEIDKEEFIQWLIHRGFQEIEISYSHGQIIKRGCKYTP